MASMRAVEHSADEKSLHSADEMLLNYYLRTGLVYYSDNVIEGFSINIDLLFSMYKDAPKKNIMLSFLEHDMKDAVEQHFDKGISKGVVIGYVRGDIVTKKHELCHAYYELVPSYAAQVDLILSKADLKKAVLHLKSLGYKEHLADYDEINAYCTTSRKKDLKPFKLDKNTIKQLKNLANKFGVFDES